MVIPAHTWESVMQITVDVILGLLVDITEVETHKTIIFRTDLFIFSDNAISLVECTCPAGYLGNGFGPNGCIASLTPWSPCNPNPCKNATCIVGSNSTYTCQCNAPYFGM